MLNDLAIKNILDCIITSKSDVVADIKDSLEKYIQEQDLTDIFELKSNNETLVLTYNRIGLIITVAATAMPPSGQSKKQ